MLYFIDRKVSLEENVEGAIDMFKFLENRYPLTIYLNPMDKRIDPELNSWKGTLVKESWNVLPGHIFADQGGSDDTDTISS